MTPKFLLFAKNAYKLPTFMLNFLNTCILNGLNQYLPKSSHMYMTTNYKVTYGLTKPLHIIPHSTVINDIW